MEPDGVEPEGKSDETQLVVVLRCASPLRSRDGDVVMFAEDVVGELETDDSPVNRVGAIRAPTSTDGVFADDAVGALW